MRLVSAICFTWPLLAAWLIYLSLPMGTALAIVVGTLAAVGAAGLALLAYLVHTVSRIGADDD